MTPIGESMYICVSLYVFAFGWPIYTAVHLNCNPVSVHKYIQLYCTNPGLFNQVVDNLNQWSTYISNSVQFVILLITPPDTKSY